MGGRAHDGGLLHVARMMDGTNAPVYRRRNPTDHCAVENAEQPVVGRSIFSPLIRARASEY
jgi:hypothetical protein